MDPFAIVIRLRENGLGLMGPLQLEVHNQRTQDFL